MQRRGFLLMRLATLPANNCIKLKQPKQLFAVLIISIIKYLLSTYLLSSLATICQAATWCIATAFSSVRPVQAIPEFCFHRHYSNASYIQSSKDSVYNLVAQARSTLLCEVTAVPQSSTFSTG